jgi:DNA phosphorothioation-associated putative methyltransferase
VWLKESDRSTLDTLLYLGTSIFSGRASFGDLPVGVQADIKRCFKSYREACARADRLLAKIRDDAYIRGAMQNSPGKMTASALYVHQRAVAKMPVVLRLYEHCGFVAAGRPADWNILKLDHRGRRVSWSAYPEFDTDPHPRLDWTYGVEMSKLEGNFQSFGGRSNRPLLHRKEEFLADDDPMVPKYRRLTASELRAGLYQNPTLIGLENGWAAELKRCGVVLRGHRLMHKRVEM